MRRFIPIILLAVILLSSCGKDRPKGVVYNELGRVMVVEYHRITSEEGDWARTKDKFKDDLERFYDLGFRLVSINDLFNNCRVNIPAGKKPLVMTFDDASPNQFKFLIVNGTTVEGSGGYPKIDPDCAVGILDEFNRKHGDFGRAVTFFCNSNPFYQPECKPLWKKKLQYLVKTGRYIGNHTFDHGILSKLDFTGLKRELAMEQAKIFEALPSYEADSVALPDGVLPKEGKWLLQNGTYQGITYHYNVAFLVGSGPTLPPYHTDFIPYMVQRVQASDEELDKWLSYMEKHPDQFYTSDGDPNSISIQQNDEDKIDRTALKPGMKIKIFNGEKFVKEIKIKSREDRKKNLKIADKGVYYTFHSAGMDSRTDDAIANFKKTGLNTLVIDLKDVEGTFGADLNVPLAKEIKACQFNYLGDIKALIKKLHDNGIRASARIAVFKDRYLAKQRPDLALKSKYGSAWAENDGVNWVNPFSPEVRKYVIDIAEEAAKAGFDEVQFDYIRFPEKGHVADIALPDNMDKYIAIEKFLKEADERLENYNVSVAIDVFGVMAWLKDRDIGNTGQRIGEMAKYVYAVCPMLYPSHFGPGFNGHKDPSSEPYHFVNEGCIRTQELCRGSGAMVIPWIQGFNWRAKDFNEDYVLQQLKGAKDAGINRFLVWNAGNKYSVTYSALEKK